MKKRLLQSSEQQPADPETAPEDSLNQRPEKREAAEIITVADLLDNLNQQHELSSNQEQKQKIARQIVKIELALMSCDLATNQVKVEKTPAGVLGFFDPHSREIALSEDLLSDFSVDSRLLKTVARHEKTHAQGLADEGLAQIKTQQEISATAGIYPAEQRQAKRTFFHLSVDKALELYDLGRPERLADGYLTVGLTHQFKSQTKPPAKAAVKNKLAQLSSQLKAGAPRLFAQLEARNYDFKARAKKILSQSITRNHSRL